MQRDARHIQDACYRDPQNTIHYGLLGLPQQEITGGRLFGAALIVAGVMLVRFL